MRATWFIRGLFAIFVVMDFLPGSGAPFFRYAGSDPSLLVWNFGWPLPLMIYDGRSGFHIGPFMSSVVCGELFLLCLVIYLWRVRRKKILHSKSVGACKISGIPTEAFKDILKTLRAEGWKTVQEYDGFDAWIDYGMVILQMGEKVLRFEWDNWMEGTVEGQKDVVEKVRHRFSLQRSDAPPSGKGD